MKPEPCDIKTDPRGRTKRIAGGGRDGKRPPTMEVWFLFFVFLGVFLLAQRASRDRGLGRGEEEVPAGHAYPQGACSHAQICAGGGMLG